MQTTKTPLAVAVSGISFPDSLTMDEAKGFVKQCFAHESNAFAADSSARADSLRLLLVGIAVANAAFNDSSKIDRMRAYAATLPKYKTDKHGVVKGSIGAVLTHAANAASIGKSLFKADETSVDVAFLLSLPSWSGLQNAAFPAPKAKAAPMLQNKVIEPDADAAKAAADKVAADKVAADAEAARNAMYNHPGAVNSDADGDAAHAQAEAEAEAARIAEEAARAEAEAARMAVLTAQGRTMAEKAHALCALANDLGIVLSKAQLAKLDRLEVKAA